jgi:hypothetical protein
MAMTSPLLTRAEEACQQVRVELYRAVAPFVADPIVAHLLSDEATFLTGAALAIDGGATAQ